VRIANQARSPEIDVNGAENHLAGRARWHFVRLLGTSRPIDIDLNASIVDLRHCEISTLPTCRRSRPSRLGIRKGLTGWKFRSLPRRSAQIVNGKLGTALEVVRFFLPRDGELGSTV
jgi:hypothetical protein